jgi:AcrR family transcriptional regulator
MNQPIVAASGLRERNKQRTRQQIADTAMRLFRERGFHGVTVAEIARAAEVSEQTVFNYFPTKEDLVYGSMESFQEALLQAVRARPADESILEAFGRFILQTRGLLADQQADEELKSVLRVIAESPALLARERQVHERHAELLAELIREETGVGAEDIRPWVAANAMIGVHRVLVEHVRRRALAGTPNRRVAREVRQLGEQALAALTRGLGDLSDWTTTRSARAGPGGADAARDPAG